MLWLIILVGLALAYWLMLPLWVRIRALAWQSAPEKPVTWRLVFPREARFGVPGATAWFTAMGPLLGAADLTLTVEVRGEDREVELRLSAPRTREVALRAQLTAWVPGARLERINEAEPPGPLTVLPLRLAKP